MSGTPRALLVPFHCGDRVDGFVGPPGAAVLEPDLPAGTAQVRMIALFRELASRVAAEKHPLVYAGNCMAPLGALAGLQRRGVGPSIVWFDAHGDFNTWETTPSGYIGGMPLAMIVGRGEQTIIQGIGLETIEPERIVIADARDVDPEEGVALARSGVRVVAVEGVFGALPDDGSPVHVHLDVDIVAPDEMPALRFPAAGGPSLARVEASLLALKKSGRVMSVTVACTWDPARPDAGAAVAATDRLVASLTSAP